jgi:PAS domain S-box-containing protein
MKKQTNIFRSAGAGVVTISMVYLAFGLSWILFSDALVQKLFSDSNTGTITIIQTYKGLAYVIITTVLLLFLVSGFAARLKLAIEQKQDTGNALKKLMDEVGVGIAQLDIHGRFTYANPDCCKFFGITEEELMRKTIFELTYTDDLAQERKNWDKLLRREISNFKINKRFVNNLNPTTWAQEKISIVEDNQRDPKYFVLVISSINELKEAENKLEENIRYYQSLLENSFDGVSIIDSSGIIKYQTPSVEKIIGYTPESRLGSSSLSLIAPEDFPKVQSILADLVSGKTNEARTIIKYKRSDNQIRFLDIYAKSMLKDLVVNGIVINFRDITEKYLIEEKLIESEEQYKLLFLHNPLPVFIYDTKTLNYLQVNDAAVKRYGYSSEEFLSMTIKDIRPAEDIQKVLEDIAKVDNNELEKRQIWRHLTKSGELIYVEISAVNIQYKGKPARMSIANDVTDIIENQENIRQSEERYRHLVENLPAGAVLVQSDSIYFNKAISEITGYSLEEINNVEGWFNTLYGKDGKLIRQYYEDDKAKNFKEPRTVSIINKNGDKRWLTFFAYKFDTGEVWLVQDVTERKKLDELIISSILEAEDRERKRIAEDLHDGIGHLLATTNLLLTSIETKAIDLDQELKDLISSCHATLQKAMKENRNITANLTPLNLENENIIQTLELLFANFKNTTDIDVLFTHQMDEKYLDQNKANNLYRIAQEALNNVIKHSKATLVKVDLSHVNELVFKMEDNGQGFNSNDLTNIKGIGLSNISNRVKAMGGKIDIVSLPESGTNLIITIPI